MPGLIIDNVWTKVDGTLRDEILGFWQSNNLLPPGTNALERAREVVLTVRSEGKIVGISSAGFVRFRQLNDNLFYMVRMAVLPDFRMPGIQSKLVVETRDLLEKFAEGQTLQDRAIGLLVFVENPHLKETRNEAVWPDSKLTYIGSDKQGRHIRVYYFKGARI